MWGVNTQAIYIEYAFLENFLLDGALLFLALRYSGCKVGAQLLLAAALGGVVAVAYPLFALPAVWGGVYKIATGVLLPLCASWKEGAGKSSLCLLLFFAFSFFVAGGVFALAEFLPLDGGYFLRGLSLPLSAVGALALICLLIELLKKIKRRKQLTDFFVECDFLDGRVRAKGFIDTGNRARRLGMPICFVSPALFSRLHSGEKLAYALVKTVAGERKIPLVKLKNLRITQGGQTHIIRWVYLSPSLALLGREYEILLGAWACAWQSGESR